MSTSTSARLRIVTLPGVYRPSSDTQALLDCLSTRPPNGQFLELCTGTGVVALSASRTATSVTAVDWSWRAVGNARLNAVLNGARVEVVRADLFQGVAERRFDMILANPPYVPTPVNGASPRSMAWDGGWDGRDILDRLASGAATHLRPGGSVLIVQSIFADEGRTADMLAASGLEVALVQRRREPLGPVSRLRVDHLAKLGVLDRCSPIDELVLIEGRHP